MEQFEKGQRAELAAKERQEISIIETYLPKALSPRNSSRTVDAVIHETGATSAKDMGAVMKAVMARLAGQPVDGKVSQRPGSLQAEVAGHRSSAILESELRRHRLRSVRRTFDEHSDR